MKERFIIIFFLIITTQGLFCQTFLESYNDFCIHRLDSIKDLREKKGLTTSSEWIKQYKDNLQQKISQFDIVFSTHKKNNKNDFNIADSIIIIYQTGVEDDLSTFIIYNEMDTISYKEVYKENNLSRKIKDIVYKPFFDNLIFDERDSLIILANKKDFVTANRLANENYVLDGASTTILFAKRINGRYVIDECYLKPFGLPPSKWRKK